MNLEALQFFGCCFAAVVVFLLFRTGINGFFYGLFERPDKDWSEAVNGAAAMVLSLLILAWVFGG